MQYLRLTIYFNLKLSIMIDLKHFISAVFFDVINILPMNFIYLGKNYMFKINEVLLLFNYDFYYF